MSKKHLYKITFLNQGQVYEIFARKVRQSDLYGFIEITDFVFGEKSAIVIDPSEERLKSEFEGVEASNIPMTSIIRIDEVEKRGTAKIIPLSGDASGTVPYPASTFTMNPDTSKSDK